MEHIFCESNWTWTSHFLELDELSTQSLTRNNGASRIPICVNLKGLSHNNILTSRSQSGSEEAKTAFLITNGPLNFNINQSIIHSCKQLLWLLHHTFELRHCWACFESSPLFTPYQTPWMPISNFKLLSFNVKSTNLLEILDNIVPVVIKAELYSTFWYLGHCFQLLFLDKTRG